MALKQDLNTEQGKLLLRVLTTINKAQAEKLATQKRDEVRQAPEPPASAAEEERDEP